MPLVGFRRDIQGLRAIAVLSVVIYHASAGAWPSGGFVGVDVFFVISGFLITGTLLKDIEQRRFSLVDFYQRRMRRLFPALFTVLLFTLVAGAFLLSGPAYRELAGTAAATVLFVSNVAFLELSGYFDGALDKPLLHTWSLAVEEQFYIFFPVMLYSFERYARWALAATLVVVAAASLGLSAWMSHAHPSADFYLAPPRAFELLIGALLARNPALMSRIGLPFRDVLSVLGLALIGLSLAVINDTSSFPGVIALLPCIGAGLVLAAGQTGPSLGGRLISTAPFVLFGNISYSLYLWHWPLLALGSNWALGPLSPVMQALLAGLSIIVAYASWRWIELPIIRGWPSLKVIRIGVGMIAGYSAVCVTLFVLHGVPQRFSPTSRVLFAAKDDYNRRRPLCHSGDGEPIPYSKNCVFGALGVEPSVAVWADSHGAELTVALGDRMARSRRAVMQITASSCPPALNYPAQNRPNCPRHNADTLAHLIADKRIIQVLMLAAPYPQDDRAALETGFEAAVRALTGAGKQVVLFQPIPTFAFDVPTAVGLVAAHGGDPSAWGIPIDVYADKNAPFLALTARLAKETGVSLVPTARILCPGAFCGGYSKGEGVLYFDAHHLSVTGARRLAMAVALPESP